MKTKQNVKQRLQRLLIGLRCSLCWGRRPHSLAAEPDRRWNRKTVSLVSWVMIVVRLPISSTSSIAMSSHVPQCLLFLCTGVEHVCAASLQYLAILCCAAWWAAAPGVDTVSAIVTVLLLLLLSLFTLGNHDPEGDLKIRKIYEKLGISSNPCSHDLANCHAKEQR